MQDCHCAGTDCAELQDFVGDRSAGLPELRDSDRLAGERQLSPDRHERQQVILPYMLRVDFRMRSRSAVARAEAALPRQA